MSPTPLQLITPIAFVAAFVATSPIGSPNTWAGERVPATGKTQEETNFADCRREWAAPAYTGGNRSANRNPWHPNLDDTTFQM